MYKNQQFTVSVAPMMDWTDRHCRWFHRQLSRQVELYTEMVVADAVIHGPRERLLGFDSIEHPVVLQVGGSEAEKLAEASAIGEGFGYDGININIGCPSDRVQSGRFGACLMSEPRLVAQCFKAMQKAVSIPVTVKCRLGIDNQDTEKTLPEFLKIVSDAGCDRFIIHARKAWLKGLSPKENRDVPPLDYDLVRRMKTEFSHLKIELNGGLADISTARKEAQLLEDVKLDGVMFGRAAYHTPWILTDVDHVFYGETGSNLSREEVVQRLIDYLKSVEGSDRTAKALLRHIMGLYSGQAGARLWRRTLSEQGAKGAAPSEVVAMALQAREDAVSRSAA